MSRGSGGIFIALLRHCLLEVDPHLVVRRLAVAHHLDENRKGWDSKCVQYLFLNLVKILSYFAHAVSDTLLDENRIFISTFLVNLASITTNFGCL